MTIGRALSYIVIFLALIGIAIGAGYWAIYRVTTNENPIPKITNAEEFKAERQELEAILAKDPDDMKARQELASLLYNFYTFAQDDALSAADAQYKKIASAMISDKDDNGEIAKIYFHRGNIARELKSFAGAVTIYEDGLKYDQTNATLKYNIAYTYLNDLKDYKLAEKWMDSIGDQMKNDPAFYYNLARIYFEQKRYGEAAARLDKVMEIDPANAETVRNDLYRRTMEAMGQYVKANQQKNSPIEAQLEVK
ncbi:MAG: tetratricopeptide repeat protein [Patescibacteria group bacterium]|nr:tetratricopeptide repeat protein [Patescibacteria group bacterium]